MKFCIKCGTKLNDDDLFCYKCGQKCDYGMPSQEKANEEPVVEPVKTEPIVAQIQEEPVPQPLVEEPVSEPIAEEAMEQPVKEPVVEPVYEKPKQEPVVENTPRKEEPKEETPSLEENKKSLELKNFFKPAIKGNEMNESLLLRRGIVFTAILLGLSIVLWFIGAFVNIHVAIRVIIFLLALGLCVLPTIDAVFLVIYFIKNKKFMLFITVVFAICLILLYTLMPMHFSYILS